MAIIMNSKYTRDIILPHGFKNMDNALIKKIQIRALNGFDEEFLNTLEIEDGANSFSYPIKTNMLLNRIINFFDVNDQYKKYKESEKLEILKKMTIGDRVYIILYLRMITFGDTFQIDLQCESCKNLMSIDLSIGAIINNSLSAQNNKHYEYVSDIQTDHICYKIEFSNFEVKIRLLNGLDQENISLNGINETELLESCIINLDSIGSEKLVDEDFRSKINSAFSELDPLSDILLTPVCPSCNNSFKIQFIVEDFFFKEIKSRLNNLEIEVHWLALNYHWAESDILLLPIPKRKRYLQLVNNTLEAEVDHG